LAGFCEAFVVDLLASERLPPETIVLDIPADLALCFDRAHLHQVLWNLVVNGLRHSSRAPGALRIGALNGERPGWVELHVVDDGPGVPVEMHSTRFSSRFSPRTIRVRAWGCSLPVSFVS
jgi:two-component system, NtrC family, sensor histidine kinase PilS